jgi:Tetratricopeptide repeat
VGWRQSGSLARTRRRGDNAGMAGDDGRAQVQLAEDTLARRRVLGDDHPDTLTSRNSIATYLRNLDEVQAARELDEDTSARRRQVPGDDHLNTLTSQSNLAADLERLGDYEAAAALRAEVEQRRSAQAEASPGDGP